MSASQEPHELIQRALATLPEDEQRKIAAMPEREQQIAHAIGLWRSGYSYRTAAAIAQVPRTTLMDRAAKIVPVSPDQKKQTEEAIVATHAAIALESSRQSLEKLVDPHEQHSLAQLTITGGVSTDKVVRIAELQAKSKPPDSDALTQRLAELAQATGAKLKVTQTTTYETEDQTLDVTPEDSN